MTINPSFFHLDQIASTNTWMLNALSEGKPLDEALVVYTLHQTQGRGQVGNIWESEPGRNIAFSLLLRPIFLPVPRQFLISQVCCLGVLDGLFQLCQGQAAGAALLPRLSIKWPNDIYLGDEKLGGILIENRLMNSTLAESVLGVGINVNQQMWMGGAPNPTSLFLHGINCSPNDVLLAVTEGILHRYRCLRDDLEGYASQLHLDYIRYLYRREGMHHYVDAQTGESFHAAIAGIDPQGPILLSLSEGECRSYWFKEVRFVLPCGITKE